MPDKTHRLVKHPRISDNRLADYMAASQQARRTILRSCKYQPIAAVLQHIDARKILAETMTSGKINVTELEKRIEKYGGKITDTDFEEKTKKYNLDYLNSVLTTGIGNLKGVEFTPCKEAQKIDMEGTELSFFPDMLVARTNVRNNRKIGALNFRYSKSAKLPEETARFQSALMYGVLREKPFEDFAVPELAMCQTIDGFNGEVCEAPTDSVYQFKEMKAVCAGIALQWGGIDPPPGAII